jgi:hypothetical protein
VAESFFATVKRELIDRRPRPTIAVLHAAVFEARQFQILQAALRTPHPQRRQTVLGPEDVVTQLAMAKSAIGPSASHHQPS